MCSTATVAGCCCRLSSRCCWSGPEGMRGAGLGSQSRSFVEREHPARRKGSLQDRLLEPAWGAAVAGALDREGGALGWGADKRGGELVAGCPAQGQDERISLQHPLELGREDVVKSHRAGGG